MNAKRNYQKNEEDVLMEEKKSNKYKTAITGLVIIGIIKLGLMYVRNNDVDNSIEKENYKTETETLLFGENGILKSRINSIKISLDSIKIASPTFTLSSESINEIIQTEMVELEKLFSKSDFKNNDILTNAINGYTFRYKIELQLLLNSYSNTEDLNDSNNLINEK